MIITKCNQCGELMHKADRCFVCGNTSDFAKIISTSTIHENVRDEYEKIEHLVKNGEFTEALTLSNLILEWMPNCSEIFWLRLLAKNGCNSDEALIRKGVSYEDSADYHNAVIFANQTQKKVYSSVVAKISAVKKVLTQYIIQHEYSEKSNTAIVQIQSELSTEMKSRRNKLFQLWGELQQLESQIVVLEKDCLLLVEEYMETLDRTSSEATSIKTEAYKLEQCTAEQLYKHQIQFGTLLHQSEQAKNSIDSIRKHHPWMENYNKLIAMRDTIISQISNEINILKTYESKVQSTVLEIERIEIRHNAALALVTKYNFFEVRSFLGENKFLSAFVEAGMR